MYPAVKPVETHIPMQNGQLISSPMVLRWLSPSRTSSRRTWRDVPNQRPGAIMTTAQFLALAPALARQLGIDLKDG